MLKVVEKKEIRVLGEFVKNMHMLIGQLHEKRHGFLWRKFLYARQAQYREKSHKYDL